MNIQQQWLAALGLAVRIKSAKIGVNAGEEMMVISSDTEKTFSMDLSNKLWNIRELCCAPSASSNSDSTGRINVPTKRLLENLH